MIASARKNDIYSHVRFNTRVDKCVWQESSSTWRVTTAEGETLECNVLVHAGGMLHHPRTPDIPGLDSSQGTKVHTARWTLSPGDLDHKKVSVIGTGCSSAQLIPEIVDQVESLTLFQRSAPWILPKNALGNDIATGFFAKLWDTLERTNAMTIA